MKRFFLNRSPHRSPVRDWTALLIASAVILAGIVVWNVWAFETMAESGVTGSTAPASSPAFNRSSIDAVTAIFAKRAAEEERYATGTYRFKDPSQ